MFHALVGYTVAKSGNGTTVITLGAVLVVQLLSPVTMYVVVVVGCAVTMLPVVALSPAAGLHE
jgi:hypothetical protein